MGVDFFMFYGLFFIQKRDRISFNHQHNLNAHQQLFKNGTLRQHQEQHLKPAGFKKFKLKSCRQEILLIPDMCIYTWKKKNINYTKLWLKKKSQRDKILVFCSNSCHFHCHFSFFLSAAPWRLPQRWALQGSSAGRLHWSPEEKSGFAIEQSSKRGFELSLGLSSPLSSFQLQLFCGRETR